jgi:hypothetical protein
VRLSKKYLAAAELGVEEVEDLQWRIWSNMHGTVLIELDIFHSQRKVQGTVLSMPSILASKLRQACSIWQSFSERLRPRLKDLKDCANNLKFDHLIMEDALSVHKRREDEAHLRAGREASFKSFFSTTEMKRHNGAWHFQCLEAQGFDPNDLISTAGVLLSSESSSEILLAGDAFAALHGDLDTVCYLISRWAGFQTRTKCNKSPAYFASLGGHLDVLQLIVEVAGDSSVQMLEEWDSSPLVTAISKLPNGFVEKAQKCSTSTVG